ncbi:protein fem-1 homolog B [Nematostella vectensis]|uniref:protein fem-1 homolog B n=1 Tax=Nematostella vectensis TaxID=45351 RepID=UPI00138FB36A|nr:protein fem-1 homolog B [Nematostella vectensis]
MNGAPARNEKAEGEPHTSEKRDSMSKLKDGLQLLRKLIDDPKLTEERKKVILNETLVRVKDSVGTPLILAALNGYTEVVEVLLRHGLVDVEQTCTVCLDGGTQAEGVTALWAASYSGHVDIVALLLRFKADPNHTTASNSSPLRTACFWGWKEVAMCLIHGAADVNGVNSQGSSCLMAAAYNGHKELITALINKGALINSRDNKGNTALHYAVERGQLIIVKILIKHGAEMNSNQDGMTPLKMACNACRDDIMKFFVLLRDTSRHDIVEALELLGATYANHPEKSNLDKAYKLLCSAMQHRYHDPGADVLHKFVRPPVKAYGYRMECQTPEEIEKIKDNPYAIQMEGLIVRERILRARNPSLTSHIRYRGACMADEGQFQWAMDLWKYSAKLDQRNGHSIYDQLLRIGRLMVRMVLAERSPTFAQIEEAFNMLLHDLEKLPPAEDMPVTEKAKTRSDFEKAQRVVLYYLAIALQLDMRRKEERRCVRLIKKFLVFEEKHMDIGSNSLLHLAVSEQTLSADKDFLQICEFPSVDIARLLVGAGADANVTNEHGSTPLHIIASLEPTFDPNRRLSTGSIQLEIVHDLLEAGASTEVPDEEHKTPVDYAKLQAIKKMMKQFSVETEEDTLDMHI